MCNYGLGKFGLYRAIDLRIVYLMVIENHALN